MLPDNPPSGPPPAALIDSIYRDRVLRARRQSPGQKLVDGLKLFDQVCERMKSGIRYQYPQADESQVAQILRERLARLRQVQDHGIYRPYVPGDLP